MRIKTTLIAVTAALFGVSASNGALLIGYDTVAGASITPTVIGSNVSGIDLTRGSGINQATGTSFNSNSWTQSGGLAQAIDDDSFLQFGINVASGYVLENIVADFFGDRSNTGPSSIVVYSSSDGFTTAGNPVLGATDVGASGSLQVTSPIGGPATGTVTFRLYGYGATGSTGTFDFETDKISSDYGLTISGDLSAVPEPANNLLLGAIGALALFHRRRLMVGWKRFDCH